MAVKHLEIWGVGCFERCIVAVFITCLKREFQSNLANRDSQLKSQALWKACQEKIFKSKKWGRQMRVQCNVSCTFPLRCFHGRNAILGAHWFPPGREGWDFGKGRPGPAHPACHRGETVALFGLAGNLQVGSDCVLWRNWHVRIV